MMGLLERLDLVLCDVCLFVIADDLVFGSAPRNFLERTSLS